MTALGTLVRLAPAVALAACATRPAFLDGVPLASPGNWVVVAGPTHPLARGGPEGADGRVGVFEFGGEHEVGVTVLLEAILSTEGIQPVAWIEEELELRTEEEVPGISAQRAAVHAILAGIEVRQVPLEEILLRIDELVPPSRAAVILTAGVEHSAVAFELRPPGETSGPSMP